MLNNELLKALKKIPCRDENRELYREYRRRCAACASDLSRMQSPEDFDAVAAKHGQLATAISLAETLFSLASRLGNWEINWAMEVLDVVPFHVDESFTFHNNLHPTKICTYAADFVKTCQVN